MKSWADVNGRFWVYVDGEYKLATFGIRKAIQLARLFGKHAVVVDGDTNETLWNPIEPWRYEYA